MKEEIHALRAQLEQRAREAADASADMEAFTYVVSHDLKEPLLGIETYATFLLEDYREHLGAEGRQLLTTLLDLAAHQRRMIDAIHRYSRVGTASIALEETDLNDLLIEVLDSLAGDLQDVDVRIPCRLQPARCDPSLVREVWRGLIVNGATFNDKPEKWVELGSAQSSDDTGSVFYVRDNGVGIPEKHWKSIFSVFSRVGAADAGRTGVGAGLAIAQRILQRHGGRIWVDSTVGEGSTFRFTLGSELSA